MRYQHRYRLPIALFLTLASATFLFAQKPTVRVAMVLDGPSPLNERLISVYREEVTTILQDEYDVTFPQDRIRIGDWTAPTVSSSLDELLEDPGSDVVIGLGVVASQALARRSSLPKPSFGLIVFDPTIQGLPVQEREIETLRPGETERYRVSGVKNLNYLLFGSDLLEDCSDYQRIVPFSRVTYLVLEALLPLIPELEQQLTRMLAPLQLESVSVVPVDGAIGTVLEQIPPGTEAVVATPLIQLEDQDLLGLIRGLIDRRFPSFSTSGSEDVERGLLASARSSDDLVRRARRVAINIQEALEGQDPGEMSIEFEREQLITINLATARAIGVSPPYSVLLEAELFNPEVDRFARTLSLGSVVREASAANLDLLAADRRVAAGQERVREARSPLLPQVDLSGRIAQIDKDRAEAFPTLAQTDVSATLGARQLIYSDSAWAGFDIERNLQDVRDEERQQLRLDVVFEAADAYLALLRAKSIERIQKDNLSLTRSNLHLASSRVEIGVAGREEVFRWESQIATNQRDVVEAEALRNQARIAVNRILNRPLSERFGTVEASVDDPELVASLQSLGPYIDNPSGFAVFSDFMTQEALDAAPELRQFVSSIRAKQRELDSARRSFFLPDIELAGAITPYTLKGAGSEPIPGLNRTDWFVGVTASLPLFQGGGRFSRVNRTTIELEQLQLQQNAAAQRVEQRVRSTLEAANASFIGIELSQAQARAAQQNLSLVTDSYAAGVVGILGLLDAQNQALVADLVAANAVYQYLSDLMLVQRSAGRFDYFRSPQERQQFLDTLAQYFSQQGVRVRRP